MNRNEMLETLRENVVDVVFTKKDGSERQMTCTLNMSAIDNEFHPKGGEDQGTTVNEEIVKVFDLVANGWRSFRVDSVISFEKN